jgi:hypothetical protein
MLVMLPFNSRITGHGLRVDFHVGRLFSIFYLSDFLLTHSGFSVLLFMELSAECCLYVLHFSCENAYLAVVDFIFSLGCMFACTTSCFQSVYQLSWFWLFNLFAQNKKTGLSAQLVLAI